MNDLAAALRAIVGDRGLVEPQDAQAFLQGARYGQGRALAVVRPDSTLQVAAIVTCCAEAGVQIVAQGANTGLVGASTPDTSGRQVVLSTQRLRTHCVVDVVNRSVDVDAGVGLQALNAQLEPHGLWFPIDLSADPSIGGMVATNTGGSRLIRYGDVRRRVLGVEAVLFDPPGERVHLGGALRKNNTGFNLAQLFVGTSGVAGIVTRATLELAPLPRQRATALLVPASDEAVARLLVAAETRAGDFLSAFEGMSAAAMDAALRHVPGLSHPFTSGAMPEFALLLELSCGLGRDSLDLDAVLMTFLEDCLENGDIATAIVGRGDALWRLRHALSEGARAAGRVIGLDVSVRRSDLMRFRREALALVRADFPHLACVDFGHVGDGGLHFNLVWPHHGAPPWDEGEASRVREALYDLVVTQFGGSFSAEHGIGPHNIACYHQHTGAPTLRMAGRLQRLLDPHALGGCVDLGPPHTAAVQPIEAQEEEGIPQPAAPQALQQEIAS